eukprot:m.22332 g.22332  ORF g.22332 m.22332 type:complete len:53 (-) comp9286_c0_seq3:14-172(-)
MMEEMMIKEMEMEGQVDDDDGDGSVSFRSTTFIHLPSANPSPIAHLVHVQEA